MRSAESVLAACSDPEKGAILTALIGVHPALQEHAEAIARYILATVDVAAASDLIVEAILELDTEDLANRAGPRQHGYVEPTDAAWQLLEETIEPWIEDLRRRGRLGFHQAAADLGIALTQALDATEERADRIDDCLVRQWAPDFPSEAVSWVEREVDAITGSSASDRS